MSPDLMYFTAITIVLTLSAWVHLDFSEREQELARDEAQ
jgi:hypothetical protein